MHKFHWSILKKSPIHELTHGISKNLKAPLVASKYTRSDGSRMDSNSDPQIARIWTKSSLQFVYNNRHRLETVHGKACHHDRMVFDGNRYAWKNTIEFALDYWDNETRDIKPPLHHTLTSRCNVAIADHSKSENET